MKEFIGSNFALILSILSLILSFFVASRTIWRARAKIKITQTDNGNRSIFLQSFDGCIVSYEYEDDSHNNELDFFPTIIDEPDYFPFSVLLIEIILTNESSESISILEFDSNDPFFDKFTSYSYTKEYFTINDSDRRHMNCNACNIGSRNKPIKYLQPEFTIEPYTSVRGYVMLSSGQEVVSFQTPREVDLNILTSRKKFNFKVKILNTYESEKKRLKIHLNKDGSEKEREYLKS